MALTLAGIGPCVCIGFGVLHLKRIRVGWGCRKWCGGSVPATRSGGTDLHSPRPAQVRRFVPLVACSPWRCRRMRRATGAARSCRSSTDGHSTGYTDLSCGAGTARNRACGGYGGPSRQRPGAAALHSAMVPARRRVVVHQGEGASGPASATSIGGPSTLVEGGLASFWWRSPPRRIAPPEYHQRVA